MSKHPVWDYLRNKAQESNAVHLTLIDPDPLRQSPKDAGETARIAVEAGSNGIMVGGSTAFGILDETVKEIKRKVNVPVILFPGNISGLSKFADAVFFMSLLNSRNPYWIAGAQAMSAPILKSWGLEAISMAYLLIEPGATAGFVGDANLIPREKPKIAAAYALASQYLGFKLVYLEAGSGANAAVPLNMIKAVAQIIDIPFIVGGGLNSADAVVNCVKAGANIVVQGTFVEKTIPLDNGKALSEIIQAINKIQK
ncbi:MAG: geranylgeranylglyceryl/heptaprenylglyceryl phosphate synthase [Candidatus Lokiarchaeota archaeon]|nr:geranylgeranylglyceryl/heptaprenylglyceryl phosphate synthase [Candidatus Lokiarchaeota archaeon]